METHHPTAQTPRADWASPSAYDSRPNLYRSLAESTDPDQQLANAALDFVGVGISFGGMLVIIGVAIAVGFMLAVGHS